MDPFTQHTGIVATLNRANVDTDAIIPKQFLKSIKRTGTVLTPFLTGATCPTGAPIRISNSINPVSRDVPFW